MFKRKNVLMSVLSAMVVLSLSAWATTAQADGEMKQGKVIGKKKAAALPQGFVQQGGLIWMPITFKKDWPDANAYCSDTEINGQTGWRLPTQDELFALNASGAMNNQGWNLDATWSSTPNSNGGHYYVGLYGHFTLSTYDTIEIYMTCVR